MAETSNASPITREYAVRMFRHARTVAPMRLVVDGVEQGRSWLDETSWITEVTDSFVTASTRHGARRTIALAPDGRVSYAIDAIGRLAIALDTGSDGVRITTYKLDPALPDVVATVLAHHQRVEYLEGAVDSGPWGTHAWVCECDTVIAPVADLTVPPGADGVPSLRIWMARHQVAVLAEV